MTGFAGLWKVVSGVVYLVLFSVLLAVLYEGPLDLYLQNDTVKIEDSVLTSSLEGDQHPTYVLCNIQPLSKKMEGVEDPSNYSHVFANYVGREANWYPSNFIQSVLLTRALVGGERVSVDVKQFKPVLLDKFRFGICFEMNLGSLVESTDGMPTAEEGEPGYYEVFSTTLMVMLAADPPDTPEEDQSVFAGFLVDKDEGMMLTGPTVMQDEAGVAFINLKPGQGVIFRILQEYHENMRNCSSDNTKISACVEEALSSYPAYCKGGGQECEAWQLEDRAFRFEKMKTEGLEAIKSTTGCQLPCKRMYFSQYELVRDKFNVVFPELESESNIPPNVAVIAVSIPRLQDMRRIKEVINYPRSSFFGEVGGYLGLFLGLSVWGIFSLAAEAATLVREVVAGKKEKKKGMATGGAWEQ